MFYMNCGEHFLHSYSPARKDNKALAFTSLKGHAYFYESARHVVKAPIKTEMMRNEKRGELPDYSEWRPWAGEITPDTLYHEDFKALR